MDDYNKMKDSKQYQGYDTGNLNPTQFWSQIKESTCKGYSQMENQRQMINSSQNLGMNSPQCRGCVCEFNRLEEARFWARIMEEHALFIKLGLPADQPKLAAEAQAFIDLFAALRRRLNTVTRLEGELLHDLIEAVREIIAFKAKLLRLLIQCKAAPGSNYPLLLDHIRREAMHFLNLLRTPVPEDPLFALLQEEVFWLRIMKEHIEFIIHLLDPSERELITQAEEFRRTFSRLLESARDLESMAQTKPANFNTVIRFTQDVIRNTMQLRDFKAAAFELAQLCEILSIISTPLLLDHVRREADKFLSEMEVLLPEVIRCHSTLGQGNMTQSSMGGSMNSCMGSYDNSSMNTKLDSYKNTDTNSYMDYPMKASADHYMNSCTDSYSDTTLDSCKNTGTNFSMNYSMKPSTDHHMNSCTGSYSDTTLDSCKSTDTNSYMNYPMKPSTDHYMNSCTDSYSDTTFKSNTDCSMN